MHIILYLYYRMSYNQKKEVIEATEYKKLT